MAGIIGKQSSAGEGYLIIADENGFREMDTRACVHCSGHFIVIPGSGKLRNFCTACGGATCDKLDCIRHDPERHPFKKRLDLVEAGKLPLRAL